MSALALLLAAALAAQDISIKAEVNKTQVPLDDQVVLAVSVVAGSASLPDPELPRMPNFSVYSSGRSQSFSIINGKVTGQATYTYVLVPRAVGKAVIPPISVAHGGQKASTEPLELQVTPPQAGAPPAPSRPAAAAAPSRPGRPAPAPAQSSGAEVMIDARLDRARAFVNEQVILTVRFYTAVPLLGNPEYHAPAFSGLAAEDLPPLRHRTEAVKGRTYAVTEIKYALFPLETGRVKVGSARVQCQVHRDSAVDPFAPDFMERFFSQGLAGGETRELVSDPLTLEVDPLPSAGKPADFGGAVGDFTLSAAADKTKLKAGEALTLTVTVAGRGNLKAVGTVKLPDMPSWRVYDPVTTVNLSKEGDSVQGSKVLKIVLVPRVSGDLAIPPLEFSFFDPRRREYRRAQTKPIPVAVAPGDASASVSYAPGPSAPAPGITEVARDIRYLKTRLEPSVVSRALSAAGAPSPVHGAPVAVFLAALAAAWRRRQAERDPRAVRRRLALAEAKDKAARAAAEPERAPALLSEALAGYLAARLDQPTSSLTLRKALDGLSGLGASAASLESTRGLWTELDARRFAPGGGGAEDLAGPLVDLLKRLETEVRR